MTMGLKDTLCLDDCGPYVCSMHKGHGGERHGDGLGHRWPVDRDDDGGESSMRTMANLLQAARNHLETTAHRVFDARAALSELLAKTDPLDQLQIRRAAQRIQTELWQHQETENVLRAMNALVVSAKNEIATARYEALVDAVGAAVAVESGTMTTTKTTAEVLQTMRDEAMAAVIGQPPKPPKCREINTMYLVESEIDDFRFCSVFGHSAYTVMEDGTIMVPPALGGWRGRLAWTGASEAPWEIRFASTERRPIPVRLEFMVDEAKRALGALRIERVVMDTDIAELEELIRFVESE